jgi:alpha/beta superfamily hydrolase
MTAAAESPSPGAGLVDSARTAVGSVLEEAGFLPRPEGDLFVVLHRPADRPPGGLLTVCGSLFAEQHKDYRREVRLARMLADAGLAVARFHYRGLGNSGQGAPSLSAFRRDAEDVALACRQAASVTRVAFLGAGIGSLVAARAAGAHAEAPLALWKPVVEGAQFLKDFFRARVIAAARAGEPRPEATAELLSRLAEQGHVDVMGFALPATLYDSLRSASLEDALAGDPRRVLLQPFQGPRATRLERVVPDLTARGCLVDVRPAKLAEDPWFVPDGADAAAAVRADEEQLMADTRDWLLHAWGDAE